MLLQNTCRAALQVYTPILPKTDKFAGYDSGYGTKSRTVSKMATSPLYIADTCGIPTKRARMSLTRTGDSFTCGTECSYFDFGISPTCSTDRSQRHRNVGNLLAILHDVDDIETIVSKDESKSSYFGNEETRSRAVNLALYNYCDLQ